MKKLTALFLFFSFLIALTAEMLFGYADGTVFSLVLGSCLLVFFLASLTLQFFSLMKKQLEQQTCCTPSSQTITKEHADKALFTLLKTMTSTTEGDLKSARKHLKTLENIIGKHILIDILELKILKGEKNFDALEKLSFKLLKNKDAELVGLKSLIETSAVKKNFEEALLSANKAFETRQDLYWVIENTFQYRALSGDWQSALEVLEAGLKKKLILHQKYDELKAIALYELSLSAQKKGQDFVSFKYLTHASHLYPQFVPAALELAKRFECNRQTERAKKTLIEVWRQNPTYDIAKAYLHLFKSDTPLEQVLRMETFATLNTKEPSLNNFMLAECNMKAKLYDKARAEFEIFLVNNPATKKIASLIEKYEKQVNHNASAAENWHKRSVSCTDDCIWVCSHCKQTSSKWKPFCSKCGTFNPFHWHLYQDK
ncbi:MAG: hypothetical protein J5896_02740 [Alphaproteobacteria bacterium]|nr:hypothetical protein [Alphaproteobacteria bacterium]